jgi:hypothetical protein
MCIFKMTLNLNLIAFGRSLKITLVDPAKSLSIPKASLHHLIIILIHFLENHTLSESKNRIIRKYLFVQCNERVIYTVDLNVNITHFKTSSCLIGCITVYVLENIVGIP